MASRMGAFVRIPARCQARHIEGTAGRTTASCWWNASSTTRGNGTGSSLAGTPCSSSGSITLENPYEWDNEITARFGASGVSRMAATMRSASAMIWPALRKIPRGMPLAPGVYFTRRVSGVTCRCNVGGGASCSKGMTAWSSRQARRISTKKLRSPVRAITGSAARGADSVADASSANVIAPSPSKRAGASAKRREVSNQRG